MYLALDMLSREPNRHPKSTFSRQMDVTAPGAQGPSHTADIKCGNHLSINIAEGTSFCDRKAVSGYGTEPPDTPTLAANGGSRGKWSIW